MKYIFLSILMLTLVSCSSFGRRTLATTPPTTEQITPYKRWMNEIERTRLRVFGIKTEMKMQLKIDPVDANVPAIPYFDKVCDHDKTITCTTEYFFNARTQAKIECMPTVASGSVSIVSSTSKSAAFVNSTGHYMTVKCSRVVAGDRSVAIPEPVEMMPELLYACGVLNKAPDYFDPTLVMPGTFAPQ